MDELEELVRCARGGQQDAFAGLVRRFQDLAVGYAYSLLGDFHLAEDAAQEAFVRAYLELHRLREPAAFAGWLRRLVHGCCTRQQRGRRLQVVSPERLEGLACERDSPWEQVVARELSQEVRRAVEGLSEAQRRAIVLFYVGECSHQEIAVFLEISAGAVKKRLHDARARLKEKLEMVEKELSEKVPSRSDQFARRVLEGVQPRQGDSTILECFYPMLRAAGVDISPACLAGIFGHAFSFTMNREGEVWQQSNIDWWLFFAHLDELGCAFQHFQATLKGRDPAPGEKELQKLKQETWKAVVESIDRGAPALAWQPVTVEQFERGVWAGEWGLLIGYDAEARTYVVRHPHYRSEYEVPYDGFGYSDPVNWYYVIVPDGAREVDGRAVALKALGRAVDWARGRRFDLEEAPYAVEAVGFAAYELWRDGFVAGRVDPGCAADHARQLGWARLLAADFLREVAGRVGAEAAKALAEGAVHYEREVVELTRLCELSRYGMGGERAAGLVGAALAEERKAVKKIEEVLERESAG